MAAIGTIGKRTWGGWVGIGLLALGLTACGTPQPPAGSPAGLARETPAPPADAGKDAVKSADKAPAATGPAEGIAKLPQPKRPKVALAVPPEALPGPDQLMGLSGDQLKSLLGLPSFVRRDPPAEIWQYGTATCVLDLFLYAEGKDGPHRVSHFEFRGRSVEGVAPADCYRQLLAARARSPAG